MDAKLNAPAGLARPEETTLFAILVAISFSHMMNDVIQSLVPAIYPILKTSFALDFGQIGLITLAFQLTASLLQPFVGLFTDKHPSPYSLAIGMGFTLCGLLLLSVAPNFQRAPLGGVPRRHGLIGISSGSLTRGAHGLWRPARIGAIPVSSWRQCRRGFRAFTCSLHRCAARAAQPRLVFRCGACRDDRVDGDRSMVRTLDRSGKGTPAALQNQFSRPALTWQDRLHDYDFARAGLFQIFLYGEPQQLLHVLSDP